MNFDNNATTDLTHYVRTGLSEAIFSELGNPSSENPRSRQMRNRLNYSREVIARLIHADPSEIYFVSGATEANNLAIRSVVSHLPDMQLVSTSVEHPSVLRQIQYFGERGLATTVLGVNSEGLVGVEALRSCLLRATAIVSVQWANNETGVVQPIAEIARTCAQSGVLLHVDAAQAIGRTPIDVSQLPIDYLSMSGHKLHAPAGVGALYIRSGAPVAPVIIGGDQERGVRGGTENCLGIIGLGCAVEERSSTFKESIHKLNLLRSTFEAKVLALLPGTEVVGAGAPRIGNTSNILFRRLNGQALAVQLNEAGVLCSQSSACSSQRPEPSHVLRAMGFSEEDAYSSIRFSFSVLNSLEEIDQALGTICASVERLSMCARG